LAEIEGKLKIIASRIQIMKILTTVLALLAALFTSAPTSAGANALPEGRLKEIVSEAKSWQGTPYRYSGDSRNGIDCSHFVYSIYSKAVPGFDYRMAREYLSDQNFVEATPPAAGDLIVFPGYRGSSDHVGIVTDPQALKFIGAQTSTGVAEASFAAKSYWGKRPYRVMHLKNLPEKTPKNPEVKLPVSLPQHHPEKELVLPNKR
jgi:cell wall-associated NlpC family hydrolase